jgi:hypothetical protein
MEKPDEAISEEEGRLLEWLSILIDEYENRAHPLPKAEPHKMLAYLLDEEAERPLDDTPHTPQEPRIGNPQRQARHQQSPSPATRPTPPRARRSLPVAVAPWLQSPAVSKIPPCASQLRIESGWRP